MVTTTPGPADRVHIATRPTRSTLAAAGSLFVP